MKVRLITLLFLLTLAVACSASSSSDGAVAASNEGDSLLPQQEAEADPTQTPRDDSAVEPQQLTVDEQCAAYVDPYLGAETHGPDLSGILLNALWIRTDVAGAEAMFLLSEDEVEIEEGRHTTTTDGQAISLIAPEPESSTGLALAVLREEGPESIDSVYVNVAPWGAPGWIAVARFDGSVDFFTRCDVIEAFRVQWDQLSQWVRARGQRGTDADILDSVLAEPPQRPTIDAYRAWLFDDGPEITWDELRPDQRTLESELVPEYVIDQYIKYPAVYIDVPEEWFTSELSVCTKVTDGWGGTCAQLSFGRQLAMPMWNPTDGSPIEVWLVDMRGDEFSPVAPLTAIDSIALADQVARLDYGVELSAVVINADADLQAAIARQATVRSTISTVEIEDHFDTTTYETEADGG